MQAGIVVGEEQIVFGREVPVERAQRDSGVRCDLFGRCALDALIEEAEQRRAAQRLTCALAAHRLRRPHHARYGTAESYVNIDITGRSGPDCGTMVPLIAHALVGVAAIVAIVVLNPHIFKQSATPKLSVLEAVYYIAGIAATLLGYYFNVRYINEYAHSAVHNPIWETPALARSRAASARSSLARSRSAAARRPVDGGPGGKLLELVQEVGLGAVHRLGHVSGPCLAVVGRVVPCRRGPIPLGGCQVTVVRDPGPLEAIHDPLERAARALLA